MRFARALYRVEFVFVDFQQNDILVHNRSKKIFLSINESFQNTKLESRFPLYK